MAVGTVFQRVDGYVGFRSHQVGNTTGRQNGCPQPLADQIQLNVIISLLYTSWGFLDSQEMRRKNLSDSAYVELLYQALMGRNPDAVSYTHLDVYKRQLLP